jgi:hypothetical protein
MPQKRLGTAASQKHKPGVAAGLSGQMINWELC